MVRSGHPWNRENPPGNKARERKQSERQKKSQKRHAAATVCFEMYPGLAGKSSKPADTTAAVVQIDEAEGRIGMGMGMGMYTTEVHQYRRDSMQSAGLRPKHCDHWSRLIHDGEMSAGEWWLGGHGGRRWRAAD